MVFIITMLLLIVVQKQIVLFQAYSRQRWRSLCGGIYGNVSKSANKLTVLHNRTTTHERVNIVTTNQTSLYGIKSGSDNIKFLILFFPDNSCISFFIESISLEYLSTFDSSFSFSEIY